MPHADAPLTPTGRLRLARYVVDDEWTERRAAERFQVSVTTVRRWAGRYRQHGEAGMLRREEAERTAALPRWQRVHNHHRHHTVLDGQPPAGRIPNLSGQYIQPTTEDSTCPAPDTCGGAWTVPVHSGAGLSVPTSIGDRAEVNPAVRAAGVTFRFRGSEAELAGATGDLGRMLDQLRSTSGSAVEVLLSGEHGREVTLRQTRRRGPLQLTFDDHSGQLLVQGDDSTLPIFWAALEPLAAIDHAPADGVPFHVHIEYLGEGDEAWRAPETLPLAVVHTPSR